jgi:hypothetical protein
VRLSGTSMRAGDGRTSLHLRDSPGRRRGILMADAMVPRRALSWRRALRYAEVRELVWPAGGTARSIGATAGRGSTARCARWCHTSWPVVDGAQTPRILAALWRRLRETA